MTLRAADIQNTAQQVVTNIKDYLQPVANEAYSRGSRATRGWRKAYPAALSSVSDAAQKALTQSKQALKTAADEAANAASLMGGKIRGVETGLLKVGFIYMVYRFFISDDQVVKAARRVKSQMREKPVESAVIAFGVGYLLAKIVRW